MENFIKQTKLLVNSFVIKDTQVGKRIYQGLYQKGLIKYEDVVEQIALLHNEIPQSDPRFLELLEKNKYYKNLVGESVPEYDDPIKIKILENEEDIVLNKQNLETYVDTKKEFLKCGTYYDTIIADNIEYVDFIHGCLYPIKLKDAYDADDGSLLSYNPNFLEPQEDYIIEEVNNYTQVFLDRNNLPPLFTINNPFYIASYHFLLRNHLYNFVLGLRLSKINTMYAHSFLIESKLRSKLNIWNEVKNLKSETIYWIYRNIDRYVATIGMNASFEKLLYNILDKNGLGVGSYRCRRLDPSLDMTKAYSYDENPVIQQDVTIYPYGLNKSFIDNKNEKLEVSAVNEKLISTVSRGDTDSKKFEEAISTKKVKDGYRAEFDTKVIEISTLNEFQDFNIDIVRLFLDYWAYFLDMELYGSFIQDKKTLNVTVTLPGDSMERTVSSKTGFLLAIKILCDVVYDFKGTKLEDRKYSSYYVTSSVLDWNKPLKDVIRLTLIPDGYTNMLLDNLNAILPPEFKETSSVTTVGEYLESVVKFYKQFWIYVSNCQNAVMSSNLYKLIECITVQRKVEFVQDGTNKTLDQILKEHKLDDVTTSRPFEAIIILLKACLGVEADSDIRLKELLASYRILIKKMTSYTLETIGDVSNIDSVAVCYQHIDVMLSTRGILKLLDGKLRDEALEQEWYKTDFTNYRPDELAGIHHYVDKPKVSVMGEGVASFRLQPQDAVTYSGSGVKIEVL